jgi:hypothetical protein
MDSGAASCCTASPTTENRKVGGSIPSLPTTYDELRRYGNAKAASRAQARAKAEAIARGEEPGKAAATAQPAAGDQRLSANRVRDVHVILSGALGLAAAYLQTAPVGRGILIPQAATS